MKKFLTILTCLLIFVSLTGCNHSENEINTNSKETSKNGELDSNSNIDLDKTLVVYYSATGNTEEVAHHISEITNADEFVLEPANPYTDEDLNYNDDNSRVVQEHENTALQDVELVQDSVDNWEEYETVFIGYPIWWGVAAWPVNDFVKSNDFSDKTVIPFCTSASSGLGESGTLLEEMAGTGNWLEGHRFSSSPSKEDVETWLGSLEIK